MPDPEDGRAAVRTIVALLALLTIAGATYLFLNGRTPLPRLGFRLMTTAVWLFLVWKGYRWASVVTAAALLGFGLLSLYAFVHSLRLNSPFVIAYFVVGLSLVGAAIPLLFSSDVLAFQQLSAEERRQHRTRQDA